MPVIHNFIPQQLFKSSKAERMIDPAHLSKERRYILWAGIKQLEPHLADVLQIEQNFKELKQQFNASVRFTQSDFERFTKAGRVIIEEKKHEQAI